MPRLIAIDLDGTLLTRGGVTDHDRDAIRRARSEGVEVVVATGRAWLESREALEVIGDEGVMIGAGGALLHEASSGRTIERRVIDPDVVAAIAGSLRGHAHVVHLLQDRTACGFDYWMIGWDPLHEATRWWFDRHDVTARWAGRFDQVDDLTHTVRVGTTATGTHLESIAEELRHDLGDRVMLQSWPAVVESEATGDTIHLLEAFDPTVDKWTMLARLAEERGIPHAEVAAIGDGLNDVGMIGGAGIGIAMAGADARVRRVADAETGPPGTGVGDAIHAMLDGTLAFAPPEQAS